MKWLNFKRPVFAVISAVAAQGAGAMNLLPADVSCQTGGGMGTVSVGAGWRYGSGNRWETEVYLGVVPRYDSEASKATVALKENFVPWQIRCKDRIVVEPLAASIYFTTIISKKFWLVQPDRYPSNYYTLPTRVRTNIALGQRIKWLLPSAKSHISAISAYYEIGTCDLYVFSVAGNKEIKPHEWMQLCIGIKLDLRKY